MALLRAEIRNRLGEHSIYDGIVEHQSDFQTEPMLAEMHYGSMMLCLNYSDDQNGDQEPEDSDLYIKREDGSWTLVGPAGGSAPEVTADAVASAIGAMTSEQAAQTLQTLGGEQVFVVTLEESGGVVSANKTFAEITAAKAAGMDVVLDLGICRVPLVQSDTRFYGSFVSDDGSVVTVTTIAQTNTVNVDQYHMQYMTNTVDVTGSVATINPQHNCMYICGTLTHLTIGGGTVGAWSIVFTSGETPTTTTIPATILGLEDFAAEANTLYEINVLDNRAVVGSWAVSSGE